MSLGELIIYIARNNCCRCFCDNDNTLSCRGGDLQGGVEKRIEPFKYYINLALIYRHALKIGGILTYRDC